jgi:hypothetical protein
MNVLDEKLCDVCKKRPHVAVAASPLAATSLAYCRQCLDEKREPYGYLVLAVMCNGLSPDLPEEMIEYLYPTLKANRKTREDLVKDAGEALREYTENAH